MRSSNLALAWPLVLALLVLPAAAQAPRVAVEGLMKDRAVLLIDGQRKLLRVGENFNGVALVATAADGVVVEVDGARQQLGLSRHISSVYQEPVEQVVTIPRDGRMQYRTTAIVNGFSLPVLVDTGASVVGLSVDHARAMGLDYRDGQQAQIQTANGLALAHLVNLQSVNVGGIEVNNVQAAVVPGEFPDAALLGMSYLRHVRLQEEGGILSLSRVR